MKDKWTGYHYTTLKCKSGRFNVIDSELEGVIVYTTTKHDLFLWFYIELNHFAISSQYSKKMINTTN